eukprot:5426054-Pyramimonas_sp.AAC.1
MLSGSGAGTTVSASATCAWKAKKALARRGSAWSAFCGRARMLSTHPVSYTHLTLPTILLV